MPEYPDWAYCTIAPDRACEVRSPSARRLDQGEKRDLQAREGVRHLWLVDPDARTLEAFELREGQGLLLAALAGNTSVSLPSFDAIAFPLDALWPDVIAGTGNADKRVLAHTCGEWRGIMNRREQVAVTRQAVFGRGLIHASAWPPLPASPSRPARIGKRVRRRRGPGDFGDSLTRSHAESGMESIVRMNGPERSRPSPQQQSLAKSACAEVSGSHELTMDFDAAVARRHV